jgi:hypothetical protein
MVYLRTCGSNLERFSVGVLHSEEMGFRIACPSVTIYRVSEQFRAVFFVSLVGAYILVDCITKQALNTQIFRELMLRFKHVATRDSRLYGGMDKDFSHSSVIGRGRSGLAHPATQRLSQTT